MEERADQLWAPGGTEYHAADDLSGGASQPESGHAEDERKWRPRCRSPKCQRLTLTGRSSRRCVRSSTIITIPLQSPRRSARCPRAGPHPKGWWFGFLVGFALLQVLVMAVAWLLLHGRRHLGHQCPGRLGLRHHQLRVVDRHRPRRHADLRHLAAAPSEVAYAASTASPRR